MTQIADLHESTLIPIGLRVDRKTTKVLAKQRFANEVVRGLPPAWFPTPGFETGELNWVRVVWGQYVGCALQVGGSGFDPRRLHQTM